MRTLNFWKTLFCAALLTTAFTACSDDDEVGDYKGVPEITVNGAGSTVVAAGLEGGMTEAVEVVTKGNWTLQFNNPADATWCTPSKKSGKTGTTKLTFNLGANTGAREAIITLTAKGVVAGVEIPAQATITVKQNEGGSTGSETNIAEIRAKVKAMNMNVGDKQIALPADLAAMTLTGVISSNAAGLNIGDVMFAAVQDNNTNPNSGITIAYGSKTKPLDLPAGTVITIPLAGATAANYNGVLQLSLDNKATMTNTPGTAPAAIEITADKILDYESQYIKIAECQPTPSIVGKKWTDVYATAVMETKTGASFIVNTGKNAVYANDVIPDKSGSVLGIASQFKGEKQIKPQSKADLAGLVNARFQLEYVQKTISQISEAGNYIVNNGVVVANYKNGFLMNDGTGYMLVYQFVDENTPITVPAVNDKVNVKGTVESYGINGGVLQFGSGSLTVTPNGTGSAPSVQPEAFDGAKFTAYAAAPSVKYVKYTGKLSITGTTTKYYNIAVDGTTVVGSVAYPNDALNVAALDGKFVDVTGWAYGVSSSQNINYLQTLTTAISENTSINSISAASTAQFTFDAGAKQVAFTATVTAGNKVFAKLDNTSWFSVPAGAITGNNVAVTMAENATDAAKTATLTIYIAATENGAPLASATVALSQAKKPSGGDGAPYLWTLASGDIKAAGGDVSKGNPALTWTSTALDYVGWDSTNGKGVQIGSSSKPATAFTLSTTAYSGNITSIKINASIGSGGDGKLTVKINGVQVGEVVSLVLNATDYTFTPATPVAGTIEIGLAATAKAQYIKSININPAN